MNSRSQSLDALRGLAVLMVICNHYRYLPLMRAGWMGVDLFFVLSGFLISGVLFSEIRQNGRIRLSRFLIRRGLKIYPAFYFFIGVTALLSPVVRHSRNLFSELFFLQSYVPRIWGHTWSLAVEEHFYIFLPVLLILLNRIGRIDLVPRVGVTLIALCLFLRIHVAQNYDEMEAVLIPTHLRIDALFAGVTLGYFYHFRRPEFLSASRWWVGVLGILLILPALLGDGTSPLLVGTQFSFNLLGFSLIVLWAYPRSIPIPLVADIGRYSYSIYLWHLLVTAFWRQQNMSFLSFAGVVVGSVVVGVVMAVIVEMPILALRDRLIPSAQKDRDALRAEGSAPTRLRGPKHRHCADHLWGHPRAAALMPAAGNDHNEARELLSRNSPT